MSDESDESFSPDMLAFGERLRLLRTREVCALQWRSIKQARLADALGRFEATLTEPIHTGYR